MGLRPIEMQMSIPRTQDASSVQHQAQQKPLLDQTQLAGQASKTIEELRTKNTQVDETVQLPIHNHQKGKQQSSDRRHQHKSKEGSSEESEVPIHPYKGHRIDLTL
ncbi:hypothetical protein BVG16_14340 [Paenibacillus selenitireducens]|uniref:Uncharacterized protein n=1 Tax=Paenibacillus selenitireducens TaxID=1324314 RepID=A0A1T2XCK2_9BACL|nr:hypothetical protein [Paenibacillus selenitireducens]OPA77621.1 hypothetical protein BVG16_14340 [Paenibacillus selenitireducens]